MKNEGPFLQTLTHRLAECPAEFLAEPRVGGNGEIHVAAVVGDLLRDFSASNFVGNSATSRDFVAQNSARLVESFVPRAENEWTRNRLKIVLVASWLLRDDWFRERANSKIEYSKAIFDWLATSFDDLSLVVDAPQFVSDGDRREELARRALSALGFRPHGESEPQAQNRLTTLDSIERQRVVLETRAAQMRAQAIREAMEEKARQEAAARYTRE